MPSQSVVRFQTQSESVTAGAIETAAEVAVSLKAIYDEFLEAGESAVDWALVQKLVSRRLSSKGLRLAEVASRLEVGRTGDRELRRDRDRLAEQLRSELRSVRLLLDEALGKEISAGLFRWRQLSQVTPAALVPVARQTAVSLRSSSLLPAASLTASGAFPDPPELADALDRRALELEQMLGALAPKRKRETFEIGEKGQEWREAYSARLRSQDLLFGLYRAAGKDHLAQRLRPKTRVAAKRDSPEAIAEGKTAAATAAESTEART